MSGAGVIRGQARWQVAEWVARLLVGALFIYTGLTKVFDPQTFIKEVRAYELVPLVLSNLVALVLPWVEVIAGVLLVVGWWRREARLLIGLMLVVFLGAKGIVLAQGRRIECGCVPTDSLLHFLFDGWIGVATNCVLLVILGLEGGLAWRRRRVGMCAVGGPQKASALAGDPAVQKLAGN
jgi:hypothetical protein